MTHHLYQSPDGAATAQLTRFAAQRQGVGEVHAIITINDSRLALDAQLLALQSACRQIARDFLAPGALPLFRRCFVSDAANQTEALRRMLASLPPCPTGIVQQAPLGGGKVGMWCYWAEGMESDGDGIAAHNGYRHHWRGNATLQQGDSEAQMRRLLCDYDKELHRHGITLAEECLRTWIFVQNIDVNYAGVVKGRRELFDELGLTKQTHYIASTGIEGRSAGASELVSLSGYAVEGLQAGQRRFLHALTHLNPTHEYGVTFERATAVDYGDRSHILVSGTASINNRGEIVHPGDVLRQTERMWENIDELLKEGGATFGDIAQAIVYLRDIADYPAVSALFARRHPQLPRIFVWAPVCRPGWLIEMECIAIAPADRPHFKNL